MSYTNTAITTILSKELIRQIHRKYIFANWFNMEYEGTLQQAGNTVQVQVFPDITWADKTIADAGEDIADSGVAVTSDNLVCDKVAQVSVKIKDLDTVIANFALLEETANNITQNRAKKFDDFLVDLALTAVPTANKVGSGTTVLDKANIYQFVLQGLQKLQDADIDPLEVEVGLFVEPGIANIIKQSGILDNTDQGLGIRQRGYIGMIDGCQIYTTTALKGKNKILIMQRNAGHFVRQMVKMKTSDNPNGFSTKVLGEIVYGGKFFPVNVKRLASIQYQ